jgi:FkbM family methyltransferase
MKIHKNVEYIFAPPPGDPFAEIEKHVFAEIYLTNVYQLTTQDVKNKNVLDVGGHFGLFSLFAHDLGAKQIVGIEANPANFARYIHNTKELSNIKAVNAACTTQTGDVTTITINGMGSQINKGTTYIGTISFADALSWFPDNEDVVVKMDVEGAEHLILQGTDPAIIRNRMSMLTIEMHDEPIAGPGNTILKLKNYMTDIGYTVIWQGWYPGNEDVSIFKFVR